MTRHEACRGGTWSIALPDPQEVPTLDLWPETGRDILGIGRTLTYQEASAGRIPTIRLGNKLKVPTVGLWEMLTGRPFEPQPQSHEPRTAVAHGSPTEPSSPPRRRRRARKGAGS